MEHLCMMLVINVLVRLLSNKMSDVQCSIRIVQRQDSAKHL